MNFLSSPINIVILGLENAGKTTLLRTMTRKEFIETQTTIGIDVETVEYKGYQFQAIDVGGQLVFRDTLWPHYTNQRKQFLSFLLIKLT
ncbi:MAG: ADP-ribosylation factor-like protein [Candidatus Heimdallarchaeaceae archaeon]